MESRRVAAAPPRVVAGDHVEAVPALQVGQVVEGLDGAGGIAAVGPQELRGDHRDVPTHTGHAGAVAADAADRAGHVGAMIVADAVVDGVVVRVEIPAADVVDVSVAVVVDAVSCGIERIQPHVGREVRMVEVHAFVDDPHVDIARAGEARRPRLFGLATERIRRADRAGGKRLVVSIHAPEPAARGVVGVVADGCRCKPPVRLRGNDPGATGDGGDRPFHPDVSGHGHSLENPRGRPLHGGRMDLLDGVSVHRGPGRRPLRR